MIILIPTIGRVDQQHTLDMIPESWRQGTWLVVSEEEAPLHLERGRQVIVCPKQGKGTLSDVLQWCLYEIDCKGNILFMDDDLKFCYRKAKGDWKLAYMQQGDGMMERLLSDIQARLYHHAMVGVASREGFNRRDEGFELATRQCQLHGINVQLFRDLGIKYDNFPIKQDFDVTLQLLTKGYANCLLTDYAIDSVGGSGAKGGCSNYRNAEMLAEVAHKLADKYPEFVKIVRKTTKGAWGGGERVDVNIQWKKALKCGQKLLNG